MEREKQRSEEDLPHRYFTKYTAVEFKSPLSQAWKLFYYDTPLFNFFNNLVNFDYTVNFSSKPEASEESNRSYKWIINLFHFQTTFHLTFLNSFLGREKKEKLLFQTV